MLNTTLPSFRTLALRKSFFTSADSAQSAFKACRYHNQQYGCWLITTGGEYPDSSRQLQLAIHTGDHAAPLYSASDISILNEAELRHHPYISRLGPDLLDPGINAEQLAAHADVPCSIQTFDP